MDGNREWHLDQSQQATPPAHMLPGDFNPNQPGTSGLQQVGLDLPIIPSTTDNLAFTWLPSGVPISGPLGLPSIPTSLSFQHQTQNIVWTSADPIVHGLPHILPPMPGIDFQHLPGITHEPRIMPFLGTALQQAQFLQYLSQLKALQDAQDATRIQSQEDEIIDVTNMEEDCVVVYDKQTEMPKPEFLTESENLLNQEPFSEYLNCLMKIMLSEQWKCTVKAILSATEAFLGTGDGPAINANTTELVSAVLEIKNILLSSYIMDTIDINTFSTPEVLLCSLTKLVKIIEHSGKLSTDSEEHLHQVSASLFAVMLLLTDAMSLEPGIQEDSPAQVTPHPGLLNPIGLTVCSRGLKELVTAFKTWIEKKSPTKEIELQNISNAQKSLKNFFHLVSFTVLTYYQEALVTNNRRLITTKDQNKGFAFFIIGRVVMALISGASSIYETIATSNPPTYEDFLTIFSIAKEAAFKTLLSGNELKLQDDTFDNSTKKHCLLQLLNRIKHDVWTNWQNNESLDKQIEQIQIKEKSWTWRDELRKATSLRDEHKQIQPFEHGAVCQGPGIRPVIHHPELERSTIVSIVTSGVRRTETVVDIGDLLTNRVPDGWIKTREVAAECAGFSKEEAEIEALTQLKNDAVKTSLQFYGTNNGKETTTKYAQKINKINQSNLEKLEDHNYSAKRPNVPVEFLTPIDDKLKNHQEELRRKPSKLQRKLTLNRIQVSSPDAIAQRSILTARRTTSKEEASETGPILYIEKEPRKPLSDANYDNPVRYYHEQARLRSLKQYTEAVAADGTIPERPNSQEVPTTKLSELTIVEKDAEDQENAENSDFERPTKSAKDNDSKKLYRMKEDNSEKHGERKRKTLKERLKKKLHSKELEHEKRAGVYKKLVSKLNCFCHLKEKEQFEPMEKNTISLRIHEVIARYSPLRLGEADPVANIHRPSREIPAFFKDVDSKDVLYWEYRIREFGLRLVEIDTSGDVNKFRLRLILYSFVSKDESSVHSHFCVVEEFVIDYYLKLDQVINILFYVGLNWNKARINGRYSRAIRSSVKAAEHFMGTCEVSLWKKLPEQANVITDFHEKPKMNPFTHRWVNWASKREMLHADYERKYYDQMRLFMISKGMNPNNPLDQRKPEFWNAIKEYNSMHKAPTQNFKTLEVEPAYQDPQLPKELIETPKDEDSGIDSDAASTATRVTIKAMRKKYKKTRKRGHIDSAPPSILTIDDDNLESNPQKKTKYTTLIESGKKRHRQKRSPKLKVSTMLQFLRLMEPRLPQSVMDDITKCLILQTRIILMGYISVLPRNAHLTESAVNTIRQTIHDQITRNAFFMYRKAAQHRLYTGSFDGVSFFQPIENMNNYRHLHHPKFPQNFNPEDYDRMWFSDAIGNIASNVLLALLSRKIEDWDRFTVALYHEKESTVLRAYIRELVEELCDIRKLFSGTNGYEIMSFKSEGKLEYHGVYINKCVSPIALKEQFIIGKVRSADEALSRFVNFPFNHTQLSTWYLSNVTNLKSDFDFVQNMSSDKLPIMENTKQSFVGMQKSTTTRVTNSPESMITEQEPTPFSDDVVILKEVQESMIGRELEMDEKWIALIDWRKYSIAYPIQSEAALANYDAIEINIDYAKYLNVVFESPCQTFYPIHEETPQRYRLLKRQRLRPEDDYPLMVSYIQKEAADWNELNRERVETLRNKLIEQRLERKTQMEKMSQSMEIEPTEPRGDIWDYGDGCPLVIDTESSHGSPMVEDLFSPPANQKNNLVQGRFNDKHWNWMEQKRWKAERDEEDLIAKTIAMALNPPPYLFKKMSATASRERTESENHKHEQEEEKNDNQRALDEFAKYKAFEGVRNMDISDNIAEEPMDQQPAEAEKTSKPKMNCDINLLDEPEEPRPQILEMEDFALKYGGKPPDGVDVKIRFMGKLFTWEELERKILEVEAKQKMAENERKKKIAMREAMIKKPDAPKTPVVKPVSETADDKALTPVKTVQSQQVPSPIRGKFAPLVRRGAVRTNLRSDLQKPIPIIEAHTLRKPTRAGPRIIGPMRKQESPHSQKKAVTTPTKSGAVQKPEEPAKTTSNTPAEVKRNIPTSVQEKPSMLTPILENPITTAPTVDKANDDALFKIPLLPAPRRRIRSASVPVKQPTRQELPVLRLRTPRTNLANPGPLQIKSFQRITATPTVPITPSPSIMRKSESLPILRLRTIPAPVFTPSPKKSELVIQLSKPPATLPSTPVHTIKATPDVPSIAKNVSELLSSITTIKPERKSTASKPTKAEKRSTSPKKQSRMKKMPVLPIPICKPSTSNARCGPRSLRFWNEYIPDREIRKWLKSEEIHPPASWELTRTVVERSARAKKYSKSAEDVSIVDLTEHQEDTADVLAAVMNIASEEDLSQKVAEQAAIWASIEARKAEEQQELAVLMHMEWETDQTLSTTPCLTKIKVEKPQNMSVAHATATITSPQNESIAATVVSASSKICSTLVEKPVMQQPTVTAEAPTPSVEQNVVHKVPSPVATPLMQALIQPLPPVATPVSIQKICVQASSNAPMLDAKVFTNIAIPKQPTTLVAPVAPPAPPSLIAALSVPEKKKQKSRKRGYDPDPVSPSVAPPTTPTQSEPYEYFYIGPDGLEYPIENIVAIQYHSDDENDYIPQFALLNSERSHNDPTPTYMQPGTIEDETHQSPYNTFEPVVNPNESKIATLNPPETKSPHEYTVQSPVGILAKLVEDVSVTKAGMNYSEHEQSNQKSNNDHHKICVAEQKPQEFCVHPPTESVPRDNRLEVQDLVQTDEILPEQEQLDRLFEGSLDDALLEFAASSDINIDDADSLIESHSPEEKSPSPTNPWYNRLIKYLEDTGNESSPEGTDPPTVDESDFQKELLAAVQELSMKEPERCIDAPISRTVQALKDDDSTRKSGSSSPIARRLRRRSAAQAAVVQRRNARRNLRGKHVPAGYEVPDQETVTTSQHTKFQPGVQTSEAENKSTFDFTSPSPFSSFGAIQQHFSITSPTLQAPMLPVAITSPQSLNLTPPTPFVFSSYQFPSQPLRSSFYSPPSVSGQANYLPRYVIEPVTPTYNFNEEELFRPIVPFDLQQDSLLDYDEEELLGPDGYFDEQAAAQLQNLFEPDDSPMSSSKSLLLPKKNQQAEAEATIITSSKNTKKIGGPGRKPRRSRLACALTATGVENSFEPKEQVTEVRPEVSVPKRDTSRPRPKRGRPPKKQTNQTDTLTAELDTATVAFETSLPDRIAENPKDSAEKKEPGSQASVLSIDVIDDGKKERKLVTLKINKPIIATDQDISDVKRRLSSIMPEGVPEKEAAGNQNLSDVVDKEPDAPATPVSDNATADEAPVTITRKEQTARGESENFINAADEDMELEVLEREQNQSPVDFSQFHTSGLFGMQSTSKSKRRSTKQNAAAIPPPEAITELPSTKNTVDSEREAASSEQSVRNSVPDPFKDTPDSVSVNSFGERVIVIDEDIQLVYCERENDEDDLECTFEDTTFSDRRQREKDRAAELDRELKQEAEDEINPPPPEPKEEEHFKALEMDPLMFTLDYHFDEPDFYLFPPECIQVDPELLASLVDRINGDDPNKIYEWVFANYKPDNRLSNYTDVIVERVLDNIPEGVIYAYNAAHYQIEELVMNVIHEFSVHACRVVQYKKGQLKFRSSVDIANLIRFIAKSRVDFFKALTDHCGLAEKELQKQQGHWNHACLSVLHFCLDTLTKLGASSVACGGKATPNAIRLRFDAIVYGLYAFLQQGGLVRTYLAIAEEGNISINRGLIFTCEVYLKNIDSMLTNIKELLQNTSEARVEKSVENIVDREEFNLLINQTMFIDRHSKGSSSCSKTKCLPFVFSSEQAKDIHKKVLHGRMEEHECTECERDFRHKVSVLMHMLLTHHKKFFTEQDPRKQS